MTFCSAPTRSWKGAGVVGSPISGAIDAVREIRSARRKVGGLFLGGCLFLSRPPGEVVALVDASSGDGGALVSAAIHEQVSTGKEDVAWAGYFFLGCGGLQGGLLLFSEHVGHRKGTVARSFQDFFTPLTKWLSLGCHMNRDSGSLLKGAGFASIQTTELDMDIAALFSCQIYGAATA
ncbi:hypothetical protein HPB48_014918 [Haemaphysalis longicornis]|uniref:Uncharacterized protein n=1 Tax=Haemaphysalis longicornis TaxID=44386 RepID=A0A9J6FG85_HAELO|nr:hypothetical protein HPB48_014918 [Haemaphysalis longicornis]